MSARERPAARGHGGGRRREQGPATAAARLLSVRVQGFKSFAEKTQVTFGPGISAVVGPNGSGKSNLADALRWALGEQGRALRSRRSEDVIWAGSERRSAVGMADVQLTLDNGDGLLPVDFEVVELGRRLYRSGENDYLLNRQRVRLKDLLDLLDGAHLAENAFLFIGQGMVDQALALRPEERRPLFEEVAGVRRHDRRRRKAEEQLVESEANVARTEDILGELRPQARRLAAQAEQVASRRSAADELAAALLAAAHARWHAAAGRLRVAGARSDELRAAVDAALAALTAAEEDAATMAGSLANRAALEADGRAELDGVRAALTGLQLRDGRLDSELSAATRERSRLGAERAAAEADLAAQRRILDGPIFDVDGSIQQELAEVDGLLAAALEEVAAVGAQASGSAAKTPDLERMAAAQAVEADLARRRLAEAERAAASEAERGAASHQARDAAAAALAEVRATLDASVAGEAAARLRREAAEADLARDLATMRVAAERSARAASASEALQARLEAAERAVDELERGGFATAARAQGGRRVGRDVSVEPGLRAAVDAALTGLARAYIVERRRVAELGGERGTAVVAEAIVSEVAPRAKPDSRAAAIVELARERGGGALLDAVRRDDDGAVRRLLARSLWLPDLAACLDLQASLPPGWIAVPRDGAAVVSDVSVLLRPDDRVLERRAELDRLTAEGAKAAAEREATSTAAVSAENRTAISRAAVEDARTGETAAVSERRRHEEGERAAARAAEATTREASWQDAQVARLTSELERARAAMPTVPDASDAGEPARGPESGAGAREAVGRRQARVEELRARRDGLAAVVAEADSVRQEGERGRARAEAAIALDTARIAAAETASAALAELEAELLGERDALRRELAEATAAEADSATRLTALLSEDAGDRARLAGAEEAAGAARHGLRAAEDRARGAEREALEARLGLESLREQLLVDLAGLGALGLGALEAAAGERAMPGDADRAARTKPAGTAPASASGAASSEEDIADSGDLEAALTAAGDGWAAVEPPTDTPSPGRLATLRRRFHELGAANPFAVEEYEVVKTRLDELEAQEGDLRRAIERTRALIVELDGLISRQFRATFEALEQAFAARFQQLFGGGFARLSLTDPTDLAATGVEIVASPPGKKPQALAMLSGGERALTAVALLFAMLEVRPVPFCVLDEVDAALDEANIGRFTEALRELAGRTQCIVITHNRGTIEIADALYGVTVGDDSVSRVVSLRLEEATEIAARSLAGGSRGSGQPGNGSDRVEGDAAPGDPVAAEQVGA